MISRYFLIGSINLMDILNDFEISTYLIIVDPIRKKTQMLKYWKYI
jgi:hypothetical protein